MLLWTEKFATGSPTIDAQHRQLIQYVNKLEAMLVENNPTREHYECMLQFVSFLEDYVNSHFNYEEQCMESYRCPAHQKNKQAHDHFRRTFADFRDRFTKEGVRMELLTEMNETINTWIEGHILAVDTELRPCLKR